jgi:V8-like Glu-specific endopeptidase
MADFSEYLVKQDRDAIQDGFQSVEVEYDKPTRARLIDGIDRKFVGEFLKRYDDTGDQLFNDLKKLNYVERLSDGEVPLALWLSNAIRRFGSVASLREVLERMIAKVNARQRTAEPIAKSGVPVLKESEEVVTDGVDDLLDISFLTLGAACVPAVAKVMSPAVVAGKPMMLPNNKDRDCGWGTGWLIAEDLLVTNYHVIRLRPRGQEPSAADLKQQVEESTAHFFEDEDARPGQKIAIKGLLAYGRSVETDYAVLELAERPNCNFLRIAEARVEMPEPVKTIKGEALRIFAVNIIQHPMGKAKRVALRNNKVYAADYPHLYYYTDTLEGSSGSPVFDDAWNVIALHRASIEERSEYNGNKNVGYVNQGVQMNAIFAHLAESAKTDALAKDALNRIRAAQAGGQKTTG